MKKARGSIPPPRRRSKIDVSPIRMAMAAIVRLRRASFLLGQAGDIDQGIDAKELGAREAVLGRALPPSYAAVLRHVRDLGAPEQLFDAAEMTLRAAELRKHPNGARYVPFALTTPQKKGDPRIVCFDLRSEHPKEPGELAVLSWSKGYGAPLARTFAEWIDALADAREEQLETLSNVPPRLQRILLELGFSFPPGLHAELETADRAALDELIGDEVIDALLASGSLYDHTGKAAVSLRLDDYSAEVRLREGKVVAPAEQVFPWLRSFRDEDFSAPEAPFDPESQNTQAQARSNVRDLRRAARRLPEDVHGERSLLALPLRHHTLLDAAGSHEAGLHLLARVNGSRRSLLLRLEGARVTQARYVDEALSKIHVADDGAIWALGGTWAHRFYGLEQDRFALLRPSEGPTNWLDLGGIGTRVLVWGAGALLAFDGRAFTPFAPDLALHPSETVSAVQYDGDRMTVLVTRSDFGAVAQFDGDGWLPIDHEHLISGTPHTLCSYRGVDWMLEGTSALYTQGPDRLPRLYPLPMGEPARYDAAGRPRPLHDLLPTADSLLLGSQGGFLQIPARGPAVFHRGPDATQRAQLVRVSDVSVVRPLDPYDSTPSEAGAVLGMLGSALWLYDRGHFHPVDLSAY